MDPVDKGRLTRSKMVKALKGYVSVQNKSSGALSAKTVATDSYFQQSPLSGDFFKNLYGSEEDFFARYEKFTQQYFAALENVDNHAKGTRVNIDLMKKRGRIDLSLLNKEQSDNLYKTYVKDVLQLNELINQGGLPGVEMPSANLYRKSFRYMTDSKISHPVQVLLNRSFFGFDPNKVGMDSLTVSRRNIMSSSALREVSEQVKSGNIFSGVQDGMKVMTLDVETTGVFDFSQVRSFSAVESTFSQGKLTPPTAVANMLFDSPQLNGVMVSNLNGGSMSLSKFLSQGEGAGVGSNAMNTFLDEATSFVERMLEADRIAGHNIFFDLDKITETMQAMNGFESHTRAKTALKNLWTKIGDGNYVIDTLESTRVYLNNQVNELVEASKALDINDVSKKYVNNLFAQEILSRVHMGGSAAPFSMENIALNTNLFELIEKDGKAEELYGLITRGSHVAETDVHLQTYVANYVSSGELKLWPTPGAGDQTEFGRFGRAKVLKSQAVTATTNIADVQNISANTLKYLMDVEEGKSISVNLLDAGDIFGQKLGMSGTLAFRDGKFSVLTRDEVLDVDEGLAKQYIRNVVNSAIDPNNLSDIPIKGSNKVVRANLAALSINDLGISFGTSSRADQMLELGKVNVSKMVTEDALQTAFGSVYQSYGSGLSARDQMMGAFGAGARDSSFEIGLGGFADNVPRSVAEKFGAIGDPFYFLDPGSRVASTVLADVTSGIGRKANLKAISAGKEVAFSANANLMSELGLSYFNAQSRMSGLLAASRETGTSKIIVPTELLKEAFTGYKNDLDTFRNVGLSVAQGLEDGPRVNLVWNINQQMNRQQARSVVSNLFDLMSDEKRVTGIMDTSLAGLDESIRKEVAFASTLTKGSKAYEDAVEKVLDVAMSNGIVIGSLDGAESEKVISRFNKLGIDMANDINLRNLRGNVLRSGLGKETLVVSPLADMQAARISGMDTLIDQAADVVTNAQNQKVSRSIQQYNEIAQKISDNPNLKRKIKQSIRYGKATEGSRVLADFYTTHKPKLGLGLAVSAIAGLGYYKAKKNREQNLYEESMSQMPYETARAENPLADIQQSYNYATQRINPLGTAGVVGNLDRNKIGHYQMGTNKYDHLFGR